VKDYGPDALNFASVPRIQAALGELVATATPDPDTFERTIRDYVRRPFWNPNLGQWGHDHDFGTFRVSGRMGTRHIWMLSRLFDHFGVDIARDIAGREVLDVGCWSGGVALVLAKPGAHVVAIDRNPYTEALEMMANAWQLHELRVEPIGIEDLAPRMPAFDTAFLLGVLYHLADPLGGLRHVFDVLRPGGLLAIECMCIDNPASVCEYSGPSHGRPNPGFTPSPAALGAWLADMGFTDINVGNGLVPLGITSARDPLGAGRTFAVARRPASS
jgi:SAM-dependent methyltransferase